MNINITTIRNKRNALNKQIDNLELKLKSILSQIDILKNERDTQDRIIQQLSKFPQISDHAKIRFMERVWNLNLENISSEILTDDTIKKIMDIGNGEIPICVKGQNIIIVVRNNIITTIKT